MSERTSLLGGTDAVARFLVEKRCEVYGRAAALIMDAEEAVGADLGLRVRQTLQELRRALRSALAFLTDEVHFELERLEELIDGLPQADGPVPPGLHGEVTDRLRLLHVRLARALALPHLQDLAQIIGLSPQLEQRLASETRELAARLRRREVEAQCWRHESEARDLLGRKLYQKAAKALRRAVRLDPDRAVYRNDLGVVLSLLGRTEEAVEEYRAAVSLNERHPDRRTDEWSTSYYNLGMALRKAAHEALDAHGDDPAGALARLREAQVSFEEYTRRSATGSKAREALDLARRTAAEIEQLAAQADVEPA